MASRLDPVTEELLKRVTWEWQDLEPIIQDLIPIVAPGKALRAYDSNYGSYARTHQPDPSLSRPLTDAEKQVSGGRNIVNGRIASMRNSGRIETDGDRENRRIRFKERRVADRRPVLQPTPRQQDQGGSMFGSGAKADQALRSVEELYEAWAVYQRDMSRWKKEAVNDIVAARNELAEARAKQRDYARTVQGQIESINARLDSLLVSSSEILESQVNELRDQVNILRESVREIAKDGNETSQAVDRLVNRLAGAVAPKTVLGEQWAPH